jgi:hypothetical protein
VPTTMGTTCYFSPERFEPDAHAEPSLGVDEEVVRLDVEVRDAAGVQMEEAHEAPRPAPARGTRSPFRASGGRRTCDC